MLVYYSLQGSGMVWYVYVGLLQFTGEWNGLIRILIDRKVDMVMTALTITPKRSKDIFMSMPYLETGTTIVVSLRKGAISPTAVLGI